MSDPHATPYRVRRTDPVILSGWWQKAPAIHRRAFDHDGHMVTICGRQVGRYWPILRWDHAQLFGKPCKRCFRA